VHNASTQAAFLESLWHCLDDIVGFLPEKVAVKAAPMISGVVEGLEAAEGKGHVIHVLGELVALAIGKLGEGFAKGLPCNGIKGGIIPGGGVTACGGL
jgi:hypothetical protein